MGLESLPRIARQLIAAGRPATTPVALVRWGTTSAQETLTGTLRDIAARAARARLEPPVVIVVGDVVALRDRLQWFHDNRIPLVRAAGRRGAGAPPFEARFHLMEVAQ